MSEQRKYWPNNLVDYDEEEGRTRLQSIEDRFAQMQSFWQPIFREALEDDQFLAGDQWPEKIRADRTLEGRPILTYNLLPAFCRQVKNKVRQQYPQIRVKPVEANKPNAERFRNTQGTKDYSVADVYQGIVRNIEHASRAEHAYTTALSHAVDHGFGFFTVGTRYNERDPFVQELRIQRVRNPYSIWIDPGAEEADFSDMADAFMIERVTRSAFEKKYPGSNFEMYAKDGYTGITGWQDEDATEIITYWWLDHVDDEVVKMMDGQIHYWSDIEDVIDELEYRGEYIRRDKEGEQMRKAGKQPVAKQMRKAVKRPVAKWQQMTIKEFLTPEMETVFTQIPIFPVVGEEQRKGDRLTYLSAIRFAKDAQRSYNFHRTAAVETTALAPKAPFILTQRQVNGYERDWESANKSGRPFLTYNHQEGVSPPQRQMPVQPAVAEMSLAQQDGVDIQAIIGLHEASLGAESNERTGKAVLARQAQGSTSTYHFISNLERAMEAAGRALVRAIPKVYDTDRVMRLRMPDDSEDMVQVNEVVLDEDTGQEKTKHDLAVGLYDVIVDTGPSYVTQREESQEAILELIRVLPPEALTPVAHLMVTNMAFPKADRVAEILRKLVPDQLKSPDERAEDLPPGLSLNEKGEVIDESTGQPYQPPPSPEQETRQQEAQAEQAKHQATQAKAQADQAMAQAKVAEAQQKMAEAQRDAAMAGAPQQPDVGPQLAELRQAIIQALEEHTNNPRAHEQVIRAVIEEANEKLLPRVRQLVERVMAQRARVDNTPA